MTSLYGIRIIIAVLIIAAAAGAAEYRVAASAGIDTRNGKAILVNVEEDHDLPATPLEFGGEFDVSLGGWIFEGAGAYSPGGSDSESHGAVQEDKWQRYILDARGLGAYAPAAGPFYYGAEYRFTRTANITSAQYRAGNTFYDQDEDTDFDRHRVLATAGYRRPLASWLGLAVRAGAGMAYLTQNTELESKEYDYTTGTETTTTTRETFGTAWLPAWSGGALLDFRISKFFGVGVRAAVLGTIGELEDEERDRMDVVAAVAPYLTF